MPGTLAKIDGRSGPERQLTLLTCADDGDCVGALAGCAALSSAFGSSFLKGSDAGAAGSSSLIPFLKLLMPLATSPMIDEILPLPPNSSSATTRKMSQCQMLKPPILSRSLCSLGCFARRG